MVATVIRNVSENQKLLFMKTATLKSISRSTGFSVTTVSRALGGFDDVNDVTRRIILEEAQRQGYHPNLHARLLQGQRSQAVGLIIPAHGPQFSDPFFSAFVAGVGNEAAAAGFDLLLSTHAPTPNEVDIYRQMVAGRRVDGLILSRVRMNDTRIQYLSATSMPFVVFGRTRSLGDYVYIDVDGVQAQAELTEHFIQQGHRRIAYITPPQYLTFSQLRLQGFQQAMAHHDLPVIPEYIIEGELTEVSGYQATARLLELPVPPTAIMTGNDLMAFGVMNLAQNRGLRVGIDLAVGGFDDIPAAAYVHPGLTTIHQPIYQIGQQLTHTLLDLIAGKPLQQHGVLMPYTLVVRGSSG
jgi:LacI family transcriptional regulator